MSTDRFSDSIRRKLESIRPDFSEKDWKRMQATLQQATPPPSSAPTGHPFAVSRWSARPWLMAAAAVSLVVLVSYAAWQGTKISDLRRTVSQLRQQQTTRPRRASPETTVPNAVPLSLDTQATRRGEPSANPLDQPANRSAEPATVRRPDTVYITRYVPVPAQPAYSAPDRTTQRQADAPDASAMARTDRSQPATGAQPQQQKVVSSASDQRNAVAGPTLPATSGSTTDGAEKASSAVTDALNGATNDLKNTAGNRTELSKSSTRRRNERIAMPSGTQSDNAAFGRGKRPSAPASTNDDRTTGNRLPTAASDNSTGVIIPAEGAANPSATMAALTTRPLTTPVIDWNQALARQSGRMRPARTVIVGGQEATVSQPTSQPANPIAFGFRIGAGGEVSRTVQSGAVLTELLIGRHLTLGVGVGTASFAGGTFPTDIDFDQRKPNKFKPFKHNYARGIDPRSKILNIETHTVRVQIPVSLGYRIPMSRTLSLLPSVGTTLGFQSKELVTFTYRQPLRDDQTISRTIVRPENLLHNLIFGAGVEWKRNHWVGQAGPVLTIPTVADANWQESASLGLRARLFYQF